MYNSSSLQTAELGPRFIRGELSFIITLRFSSSFFFHARGILRTERLNVCYKYGQKKLVNQGLIAVQ